MKLLILIYYLKLKKALEISQEEIIITINALRIM